MFRFILPNHNLGRQGNVGSLHWLPERHPTRVAPLLTPPEAALFLAWGSAKVRNGGGVGEVTPSSLSTQVCAGGRDASARAAERTIPGSNSALWARGPRLRRTQASTAAAPLPHSACAAGVCAPKCRRGHLAPDERHRLHLCQAPRLLGFPGRGRVGRSALQRHRATVHKLSELCPGRPEESGIQTGRGSGPELPSARTARW